MNPKRLHTLAGVVISCFIVLHLFNHLVSLSGVEAHIAMMNYLRPFYRNWFAESVLLIFILGQLFSGITLLRRKRMEAASIFEKLQIFSGIYLGLFFIVHVTVVFLGRYYLNIDTNFYFGAAGLNTFPFNVFFIPYYGLAMLAFFAHVALAHRVKMKVSLVGIKPSQQALVIFTVGVLITICVLLGLTNYFLGYGIPPGFNILELF